MDAEHEAGQAIWRALDRLVRERLARKPGGHLLENRLETLDLRLRLGLNGPAAGAVPFAAELLSSIDRWIDDAVQQAAAFRPGHAYCHRCDGLDCEHSRPPSSRHVFVGYTATGQPRWVDFAQYCLELRHPQVDRLYDAAPALVTVVQQRESLQGAMLDAFRNPSYEILGQLVAGFFPLRVRLEDGRGIVALTVQVAASYKARVPVRLGLNLLGRAPSGDDLEHLWDSQGELPWYRAVRWAQAALQTVPPQPKSADPRAALTLRVESILQGLARRLDRDHRARGRRTRHAEERHASGTRPTRKAVDDARVARGAELFVDERSGAIVVLGERGRTHFFTPDGRHVSSARYSREAIERKLKARLWLPATEEQSSGFRGRLPS